MSRTLLLACILILWEEPVVVSSWTVSYERCSSSRLRLHGAASDDNDEAAALERHRSHPAEISWYASGLPFECTECGKCCKTQGSVYMTPKDVENAASFLKVSTNTFMQTYASRTLHDRDESDERTPWVRLINTNDGACIFLNSQNQCGIYEARPVQCSTYPFWPDILESEKTWNEHVRISDDIVEESIPYWTPHNGGCEGMKFIGNSTQVEKVVSPYVAYEQFMEYEQAEQSFPSEPIIRRVKRNTKDEKNVHNG